MPESYDVLFVSSNVHKYEEAYEILSVPNTNPNIRLKLGFFQTDLEEIQDDSLLIIAAQKALDAYRKCKEPVIVEDDGLFIDSLSGFPGQFSSYVFKTIGNKGILKLMGRDIQASVKDAAGIRPEGRDAQFVAIIAFCDSNLKPWLFSSSIDGTISPKIKGKGWGYDPIFIPEAQGGRTYAQLAEKNLKNKAYVSHRTESLRKFADWFKNKQE